MLLLTIFLDLFVIIIQIGISYHNAFDGRILRRRFDRLIARKDLDALLLAIAVLDC